MLSGEGCAGGMAQTVSALPKDAVLVADSRGLYRARMKQSALGIVFEAWQSQQESVQEGRLH